MPSLISLKNNKKCYLVGCHLLQFCLVLYVLTHCRLNRLSHTLFWKSNFNFRYVQLWDLDIPREKWLNYLQTVETLIRCSVLRHLIWVCTVCQLPSYGSPEHNRLIHAVYSLYPKYNMFHLWKELHHLKYCQKFNKPPPSSSRPPTPPPPPPQKEWGM